MNRYEVIEATIADATTDATRHSERRRLGLVVLLRDASITIDALWSSALREGPEDMAAELGQASHAVHRALVALTALVDA